MITDPSAQWMSVTASPNAQRRSTAGLPDTLQLLTEVVLLQDSLLQLRDIGDMQQSCCHSWIMLEKSLAAEWRYPTVGLDFV